jgi:hypothetical protein
MEMIVVQFEWRQIAFGKKWAFAEWLREHGGGVHHIENGHFEPYEIEDENVYTLENLCMGEKERGDTEDYIHGDISFRVYFTDKHVATKAMLLWK